MEHVPLHDPPVTEALSVMLPDVQTEVAPVMVAAPEGVTKTVFWANRIVPQLLATLYLMVSIPAARPVTTPVAPTEATELLELLHTPEPVASVNVVVVPRHSDVDVPPIAAGVIGAVTATDFKAA